MAKTGAGCKDTPESPAKDNFFAVSNVVGIAYAANGKVVIPRAWIKDSEHRVHGLSRSRREAFTLAVLCNLNARPAPQLFLRIAA